jgi:soluble lytic murein transglycosylase
MRLLASLLTLVCALAGSGAALAAGENDALASFEKAHAAYSRGDLSDARALFEQTLVPQFRLPDHSIFWLATIASQEKAWDTSRRLAEKLRREYPQSIWVHAAELQQAKADLAENKRAQAATALRALRAKAGAGNEILAETLFLLGQATDDAAQAYGFYQELREQYPVSKWIAAARKEQKALRDRLPEDFRLETVNARIAEAEQLMRERAYGEAEAIFKKLLAGAAAPDLRLRLLNRLSNLYLTLRRRQEALPLLEQIARDYPETPDAPKALYQIGQVLWNRNDNARALEVFQQLIARYPAAPATERALYAAGDIFEWSGNTAKAIASYTRVRLDFPGGDSSNNATWRLAWLHYRSGDFADAYRVFKLLVGEAREDSLKNAARYWQGRAAERAGDYELAKETYRGVYDAGVENYYQALAAGALARLGAPVQEMIPPPVTPTPDLDPFSGSPRVAFHLSRARALAEVSLHQFAVLELNAIEKLAGSDNFMRLQLSREYFNNGAYRRSLALANQLPPSDRERELYRFPLAHWDTIRRLAAERNLDPYLVLALIRQESLFDRRARSSAFALGLMQLLPSTAAKVATRNGMPPPSSETLYDPETNLEIGTHYLRELLQRYSNNWHKAIAAYNAGENAVDRWEKEIATEDAEEFVERIPYLETRGYVKLVLRNHRIYKRLYQHAQ